MVKLWTCPSCDALLGIDIIKNKGNNCVSCGIKLSFDEIDFIDENSVIKAIQNTEEIIPKEFHQDIIYRWLSHRTVGILFDFDKEELDNVIDFDIYDYFEDELAEKLDLFITIDFEW